MKYLLFVTSTVISILTIIAPLILFLFLSKKQLYIIRKRNSAHNARIKLKHKAPQASEAPELQRGIPATEIDSSSIPTRYSGLHTCNPFTLKPGDYELVYNEWFRDKNLHK